MRLSNIIAGSSGHASRLTVGKRHAIVFISGEMRSEELLLLATVYNILISSLFDLFNTCLSNGVFVDIYMLS